MKVDLTSTHDKKNRRSDNDNKLKQYPSSTQKARERNDLNSLEIR